jgi:hypothetical protein
VNFVQVTGAVTTGTPIISAQGSDASIPLQLRSKGTFNIGFANGSGNQGFVVSPTGSANYLQATSSNTTVAPSLAAVGSDTNIDLALTAKGTGSVVMNSGTGVQMRVSESLSAADAPLRVFGGKTAIAPPTISGDLGLRIQTSNDSAIRFATNGGTAGAFGTEQFRIARTASAVNYVQVTGAATGNSAGPTISAQGSDSNVPLAIQSKLAAPINFYTSGGFQQFRINNTASAANFLQVTGAATGAAPVLSVQGSDTNIDLALTPKGTGLVRFGTYTADMTLIVQGFIEVKDSGGTIRKLAVIA